jgi:2-polyprenyl-3-methyl-5-hydroxy-6-metoxy-1,4-benzoquinol methylase
LVIKEYEIIDDIKVFDNSIKEDHSDYNSNSLDVLYRHEENHFWFIARKEFIYKKMNKYILKDKNIIEIGAGTGNISRYLKNNGYKNISVGEMHINGLKYAKTYGIEDCYQFNLLDIPFKDEFDVVCMFDVLEHIEDDILALKNIHKSLRLDGYIVITVPSHMRLWNRDDTILGHKRRYTKNELKNKLLKNGFEIIDSRYFFMSIIPLLFLRSLVNKDDKSTVRDEELDNISIINPIINYILLVISRIENKINHILFNFFGGSIFVVAKKHDNI